MIFLPPWTEKHWKTLFFSFFFNDTATTEIYTLSLHDALPISTATAGETAARLLTLKRGDQPRLAIVIRDGARILDARSEEHTSELQSQSNLVCRLLLEKKKTEMTARPTRPAISCVRA